MKKLSPEFVWIKIKISTQNLLWLFAKPAYLALAIALALVFFELVYWLFNLPTLASLMASAGLTISDKVGLLASPFSSVRESNGQVLFAMMIILSVVQGFSLSALVYALKNQPKVDSKMIEGSALISLLAVIGLGCPACGTSLLTPLIAMFASGSAVAISEQITAVALPLAILIGFYGLYSLGSRIATIKITAEQNNNKKD